jgi:hypothetical protein
MNNSDQWPITIAAMVRAGGTLDAADGWDPQMVTMTTPALSACRLPPGP